MSSTTKTMGVETEGKGPCSRSLRGPLFFIAILCIGAAAVETGARVLVPHISRIEGRTEREYRAAIQPPESGRLTVLVLGNSLLDAAVPFERLQAGLGPSVDARRFMVEQTAYWDWYFGIRRLFADGARPAVVVLMLGREHVTMNTVRGDYFAYRLMPGRDIFRVASDLNIHPTVTANMLAAHFSAFYALRSEIRKVLLGRLMPDMPALMAKLTVSRAPDITGQELASIGIERLKALRAEAAAGGAHFVFILVPGVGGDATLVAPLRAAAMAAGIPMITTLHDGQMLRSDYRDGFHMNEQGARKYTDALIPDLKKVLDGIEDANAKNRSYEDN